MLKPRIFQEVSEFSNFKINKHLHGSGIEELLAELKDKVKISAIFSYNIREGIIENWEIKNINEKLKFGIKIYHHRIFKNRLKNSIREQATVGILLGCFTGQKYGKDKKDIRELWGYRLVNDFYEIKLHKISHEELYEFCTTDFNNLNNILPEEEVVYCGPEGKICGWDML